MKVKLQLLHQVKLESLLQQESKLKINQLLLLSGIFNHKKCFSELNIISNMSKTCHSVVMNNIYFQLVDLRTKIN